MSREPSIIHRGETLGWKRAASQTTYVDADGATIECSAPEWTLKYKFAGPSGAFDITAVADGTDFSASASATVTGAYPVGEYSWIATVEKGSGGTLERHIVDSGVCTVAEGPAEYVSGLDKRSHVKKVLDAIEAVILGRATTDQLSYSINGRSLQKTPLPDLLKLRSQYRGEYERELRAERIRKGLDGGGNVYVRF